MHAAMNTSRGTRGKRGRLLNRNPSALEVWEGMQNVATESDCIATEMDGESTVGGESVEMAESVEIDMEMAETALKQRFETEMAKAEAKNDNNDAGGDDAGGYGDAETDATPKDLCYTPLCQHLCIGILYDKNSINGFDITPRHLGVIVGSSWGHLANHVDWNHLGVFFVLTPPES